MTTDMFMTKKDELKCYLRDRRFFATHDVIEWGTKNFYTRANRTKQDFRVEGLIRTLTDDEKAALGYKCKDDVYKWIGA